MPSAGRRKGSPGGIQDIPEVELRVGDLGVLVQVYGTEALEVELESIANEGATAVITHRVRNEHQAEYEQWLDEIAPLCKAAPGHLDWHIVRPIRGLTATYTIVLRFDSETHLRGWMESEERKRLIKRVQPLLVRGDDFFISSGLDFWFVPGGAQAQVPVRWKQCVMTWSAIYPLVLLVPPGVMPVLRGLGLPASPLLANLIITGIIVWLMIYLVMPRYTKLMQRWLFA